MTPLNNSSYSFYRTMIIGLQTELCRNLGISQHLHIMGGGGWGWGRGLAWGRALAECTWGVMILYSVHSSKC